MIEDNPFDKLILPFSLDLAMEREELAQPVCELVDLKRRILLSGGDPTLETVELFANRVSKRFLGILRVAYYLNQVYMLTAKEIKKNTDMAGWPFSRFEDTQVTPENERLVLAFLEEFLKRATKITEADIRQAESVSPVIASLLREEFNIVERNKTFIANEQARLPN